MQPPSPSGDPAATAVAATVESTGTAGHEAPPSGNPTGTSLPSPTSNDPPTMLAAARPVGMLRPLGERARYQDTPLLTSTPPRNDSAYTSGPSTRVWASHTAGAPISSHASDQKARDSAATSRTSPRHSISTVPPHLPVHQTNGMHGIDSTPARYRREMDPESVALHGRWAADRGRDPYLPRYCVGRHDGIPTGPDPRCLGESGGPADGPLSPYSSYSQLHPPPRRGFHSPPSSSRTGIPVSRDPSLPFYRSAWPYSADSVPAIPPPQQTRSAPGETEATSPPRGGAVAAADAIRRPIVGGNVQDAAATDGAATATYENPHTVRGLADAAAMSARAAAAGAADRSLDPYGMSDRRWSEQHPLYYSPRDGRGGALAPSRYALSAQYQLPHGYRGAPSFRGYSDADYAEHLSQHGAPHYYLYPSDPLAPGGGGGGGARSAWPPLGPPMSPTGAHDDDNDGGLPYGRLPGDGGRYSRHPYYSYNDRSPRPHPPASWGPPPPARYAYWDPYAPGSPPYSGMRYPLQLGSPGYDDGADHRWDGPPMQPPPLSGGARPSGPPTGAAGPTQPLSPTTQAHAMEARHQIEDDDDDVADHKAHRHMDLDDSADHGRGLGKPRRNYLVFDRHLYETMLAPPDEPAGIARRRAHLARVPPQDPAQGGMG
ncbi:hypothetical protein BC828DRAFT_26784 [Blastocladiella britannica]|nr:hypothetical protein BC828DRAFT_26784 [Blastocladiella britannica]